MLAKIREEQKKIRKEVRERTIGYVVGGFSLVAGLAWNEAIRSLIDQLVPRSGNDILIKFAYAIIVTILIVIITMYLLRLTENKS